MKDFRRYDLTYQRTIDYIKESLFQANTLSMYVLELVNFKEGRFFTYFPSDICLEDLYHFERGGISSNTYKEVSVLLLEQMQRHPELNCIIDDVIRKTSEKYVVSSDVENIVYKKELYYVIKNEKSKLDLILRCLQETDAIWHSLCLLTRNQMNHIPPLRKNEFKEICLQSQWILVGAYDGEGYIFWEKN